MLRISFKCKLLKLKQRSHSGIHYYLHYDQLLVLSSSLCKNHAKSERVIRGTKILAEIKSMLSRDKDQTWKTDKHDKEQNATKIIHTK